MAKHYNCAEVGTSLLWLHFSNGSNHVLYKKPFNFIMYFIKTFLLCLFPGLQLVHTGHVCSDITKFFYMDFENIKSLALGIDKMGWPHLSP
jgi:hypothetical protein